MFGEENFVAELTWEKKKKGSYLANDITNIKESVIVYARKKQEFRGLIGEINLDAETYPCVNASNGRDVRHIPAGIISKFKEKNFSMKAGEIISDTTMDLVLKSDLVIKDGVLAQNLDIEGNWRYGQEAMAEYARKGELYITQDLYLRRIVRDPRYKGLKDLLLRLGENEESGYSYSFDEIIYRLVAGAQTKMQMKSSVFFWRTGLDDLSEAGSAADETNYFGKRRPDDHLRFLFPVPLPQRRRS